VQKLAAANSNTATRHILQAGLYLTAEVAEAISLRISDILEYSPTRDAFIQSLGMHNVATLEEVVNMHLHDFGIFIELAPDDEEKQMLENNIQTALSAGLIDLDDAIDIREVKNIKLANQVLKIRRKKKQERDQLIQQQNIQAQAQANAQAQQVAAQAEIQKRQGIVQIDSQMEQVRAQLEQQKMMQEVESKKQLMYYEFQLNMALKEKEAEVYRSKESYKEDRKDDRSKMEATQQSEIAYQKKNDLPPKNFESSGNDILSGGFDLGSFEPR
jgi:hypothetical protein